MFKQSPKIFTGEFPEVSLKIKGVPPTPNKKAIHSFTFLTVLHDQGAAIFAAMSATAGQDNVAVAFRGVDQHEAHVEKIN